METSPAETFIDMMGKRCLLLSLPLSLSPPLHLFLSLPFWLCCLNVSVIPCRFLRFLRKKNCTKPCLHPALEEMKPAQTCTKASGVTLHCRSRHSYSKDCAYSDHQHLPSANLTKTRLLPMKYMEATSS